MEFSSEVPAALLKLRSGTIQTTQETVEIYGAALNSQC